MFSRTAVSACVPPGQRIYAVGDIHGRLDLLDQLLRMMSRDNSVRTPAETTLIFLGDYIDRGPDSKGVIERLISGIPDGMRAVFLRGNHEEMMLRSFHDPASFNMWAANGGLAALASYGVDRDLLYGKFLEGMALDDEPLILDQFAKALPASHLRFFHDLEISRTVGDYFFVHAGVRPGIALEQQSREDCLFIRQEFLLHRQDFGKVVVHGHTPAREPDVQRNRIGIDTLAFRTGRLTALRLEGTTRGFLAT